MDNIYTKFIQNKNTNNIITDLITKSFEEKNKINFLDIPIKGYIGTVINNSFIIKLGIGSDMHISKYNNIIYMVNYL